jgi:hypothetical protein
VDDDVLDELLNRMSGDPAKWQQQQAFMRALETPFLRGLASSLGVEVSDLASMNADIRASTAALLVAAKEFGEFGWTVSGRMLKSTDYVEAVELWQRTHDEADVDEHLTRAWADGRWLRGAFGPLTSLAGKHEATLDMLLERNRLMSKALAHHEAGEYEASTMLALSQVDGLTLDFTENRFGFFYRAEDQFFEDDETVAGMPQFLRVVRHAVNEGARATSTAETALRRHPIMHGRYLAFGTETNSTKAFALMAGVLEWLKPRAAVLAAQWQAAHEAEWAGSMERDADGKRLDRRGFVETREALRWLAIRQMAEHRDHGRYNPDLRGMFPRQDIGPMKRRDQTTLVVAPDGQSWWAWCPSDTPLVFGIGAKDGETTSYYYAEDNDRPGPLGEDPRWLHEFDQSPDWSGD